MAEIPRRRIKFKAEIEADSIDDLTDHFRQLAFEISTGSRKSVCGGYHVGSSYEVDEDESITHESWNKALNVYIKSIDARLQKESP